jgi:hypothetical protein
VGDGLLLVAEPQSSAHFSAVRLAELDLARAFGPGWDVRGQGPIALDDTLEPEPDVAVVRGGARDYVDAHPAGNLVDRVLEVRRDPAPSPSAPFGWDYRDVTVLGPRDSARPLAAPAASIAVADLLP